MQKVLIFLINFYQAFLSFDTGALAIFAPGGSCKYPLRCSEYTKEMIIKHGSLQGLILGGKRIISCR